MFGKAKDDKKKKKRFIETYQESILPVKSVLVDTQTGVNYLMVYYTDDVAITPLLNADGSPIVTPISESDDA